MTEYETVLARATEIFKEFGDKYPLQCVEECSTIEEVKAHRLYKDCGRVTHVIDKALEV